MKLGEMIYAAAYCVTPRPASGAIVSYGS